MNSCVILINVKGTKARPGATETSVLRRAAIR